MKYILAAAVRQRNADKTGLYKISLHFVTLLACVQALFETKKLQPHASYEADIVVLWLNV
jgi:hypothetical protein